MKKTFCRLISILLILFFKTVICIANEGEAEFIKVEIKGRLETGVMAIGGETTGTVIRVKNVTWELDFGGSKELQNLAGKYHKKTILVTGTYHKITGVETRERHIVKVATLKSAEKMDSP